MKTSSHGQMIQKQSQKALVKLISNLIKTKIIAGHKFFHLIFIIFIIPIVSKRGSVKIPDYELNERLGNEKRKAK